MRLSSALIIGYRSLREVEIELTDLTACIGPNGSGKSSFLGAVRLFFDPSSEVVVHDFWSGSAGKKAEVISVTVTFVDLDDAELATFSEFVDAETRSVTFERRFEEPGNGIYLARRLAVPEFSQIRMLKRTHRDEYNELVRSNEFEGLPIAASKDDAFEKMAAWERSHPERCEVRDEEVEVVSDILSSLTFVSIGAFDDPSEHVEAEGRGAVSRLLASLVEQDQLHAQLQEVAKEATGESDRILVEASQGFEAFTRHMEENLSRFSPGNRLAVAWSKPEIKSSRPRLRVEVETSDGLTTPLEYQGHGVQRALMYAALAAQATGPANGVGRVILLIEEPEAFQHPLSCRVLANTLRELSGRNFQIIYSTHSPFFIHPDLVEGLKIFRREVKEDSGSSTRIKSLAGDGLLKEWERVFEGDGFTIQSVLARLKPHLPPRVLEGLFARVCVLVEGDEDEAVVRGSALHEGLDLDAAGVAVIQSNGKTGMPNVLAFYGIASVPAYPIFDLDRGKPEDKQHREAEGQILRALGLDEGISPGIHDSYACSEKDLTNSVQADIGDSYEELLEEKSSAFGYPPNRGRKVPAVVASLIHRARQEGNELPMLSAISQRLLALSRTFT